MMTTQLVMLRTEAYYAYVEVKELRMLLSQRRAFKLLAIAKLQYRNWDLGRVITTQCAVGSHEGVYQYVEVGTRKPC